MAENFFDEALFQALIQMQERPLTQADYPVIRSAVKHPDGLIRSEAAALLLAIPCSQEEAVQNIDLLISLCDDPEMLVRTEAYDALSWCISSKAEQKLFQAIQTDADEIARSFAIFSWADMVSRHKPKYWDFPEEIAFIRQWMQTECSEHCQLSCAYSLYAFHAPDALVRMLSFLQSEDYRIRCSAVHHFTDSARKEDIPKIRKALQLILPTEETRAVRCVIEKFMKKFAGVTP